MYLKDYIIIEQRAGEEWFDYQKRCKGCCKEIVDLKKLENLLDSNFFCSRQFDHEDDYWILAFPTSDVCSCNCDLCQATDQQKKENIIKAPVLFIKVYESEFPAMRYFIPVTDLTFNQIAGNWTVQRFKERCCLECRHAKILDKTE